MKNSFTVFLLFYCTILSAQISNLSFGTENTLDVMTWNLENFPKNGTTTLDYVKSIVEALDPDVIAVQEISNENSFFQMANDLSSYTGYTTFDNSLKLGYLYKNDIIQVNQIYEIYTQSIYQNTFPRAPMILDLDFSGERFIIINNHYKCCGDGFLDMDDEFDEETRRYNASNLLKSYIDSNFNTDNVILLGDLNDNIVDPPQNNVFQMFIDDSSNFVFADINIASGSNSNWSFPSWPSHLDHILITNELFDEFAEMESDIETIKIDEFLPGGFSEYDQNVSDHRPVGLKLFIESGLNTSEFNTVEISFKNYPNPFNSTTTFSIGAAANSIEIFNLNGQKITTLIIDQGQSSINLKTKNLSNGIYLAKLISNNTVLATRKIVLLN